MDSTSLPTGYIAIALSVAFAIVFWILLSKERNANGNVLKLLHGTKDDLEKLRSEVTNKANQISILMGEIARIEQIAEQQGSDSKLHDISVLSNQLRSELQKATDRLAKDEERFSTFATDLESLRDKQEKLIIALSTDKIFELAETKDAKDRAELLLFLRNAVNENLLAAVQEQALRTALGTATVYVLSQDQQRQDMCVDNIIQFLDQAESDGTDTSELVEAASSMLAEAPIDREPAIRLIERLSALSVKRDDLAMAEGLYSKLGNVQAQLGPRVNSPSLRRGLAHVVRLFEKHGSADKLESAYRHIHELYIVDPDADKARMAMNIKKLARLYVEQERYHEAEAMYGIVLYQLMQTEGPENRDVILHLRDFARLYLKLNKLNEAYKTYLDLLTLPIIREYEDLVPLVGEVEECAAAFNTNNKAGEAQKLYETCLAALENTDQEPRLKKALEVLSRVMTLYEQDEQTVDPELLKKACDRSLRATLSLAELQRLTRQFDKAQQSYEASLKIAGKTYGAESPRVAEVLEKYATLAKETGNQEKARTLLEQAERIHNEEAKTPQTA